MCCRGLYDGMLKSLSYVIVLTVYKDIFVVGSLRQICGTLVYGIPMHACWALPPDKRR
jgi:hypothetical protein